MTSCTSIAVVTGAAGGIGADIAKRLGADGYSTHAVDVSRDVEDVVAAIREDGGRASSSIYDLRDVDAATQMFTEIPTNGSRLTVLVNAAGISVPKRFHEVDSQLWDSIMNVNAK